MMPFVYSGLFWGLNEVGVCKRWNENVCNSTPLISKKSSLSTRLWIGGKPRLCPIFILWFPAKSTVHSTSFSLINAYFRIYGDRRFQVAIKTCLGNGEEEKNQTGALLVEGSRHGRRKPPALQKGLEAAVEHRLRIRLIFRAWGEPAPCSLHRPGSFGAGISSHRKKDAALRSFFNR